MSVALRPGETGREWMERRLKEIAGETASEWVDRRLKEIAAAAKAKAEAEVRCPECGYLFDDEDMADVTTYYGEDGEQDVECSACLAQMVVTETVTRTYKVELA